MTPAELAGASGWTVDTMLESIRSTIQEQGLAIDRRFVDLDRRLDERALSNQRMLDERAVSAQRAIDALAVANEKALVKVDEKTEKSLGEIRTLVASLSENSAAQTGRQAGVSTTTGLVLATISLVIAFAGVVAGVIAAMN